MRMNYKTKRTLTQALSIVLVCLVGFGAVMGLSALSEKLDEETKIIYPTFEVGGINAEGKGDKEIDGSIYTKEAFECKGLEIRLDFDANIKYKVYYYDDLDTFMGVSPEYDEGMKLSVPAEATHARVVVTPIWNKDVELEDRVCHWYDVAKYSTQLEITVLKDQEPKLSASEEYVLTDSIFTLEAKTYYSAAGTKASHDSYNSYVFTADEHCVVYVDCTKNDGIYWQYNIIRADGTAERFKNDEAGFVYGEAYEYELNTGDKFIISLYTDVNVDSFTFNVASYDA